MGLRDLTISRLFQDTVERYGDELALTFREKSYTWRELDILSDIIADRLEDMGVRKGDHVGIWGENSTSWIVTFLALQKLGAVTALLNFSFCRRELVQVMRIGDVHYLCYGDAPTLREQPDVVESATSRLGESLYGVFDFQVGKLSLRQLLDNAGGYRPRKRPEIDSRATACMLYTSGTASEPKCVLHNHYALVNNAIITGERIALNHSDRFCVSQPLFHMFGLTAALLASISAGVPMFVLSNFGSEDILRCVSRYGCTILNGVPTNFLRLLSNPAFPKYDVSTLRVSAIGGAPVTPVQMKYIREAFPTTCIMTNYGLTEGCCLCNTEFSDGPEIAERSVGRPYPCVEVAIQDPDTCAFLPAGQRGEIVVRGYSVMQGFFGLPENLQRVDKDGWLHTEDLGVMDKDGYLSVVGRIKDIIIRGGEDITPAEIRKEIMRYEPILDVLVLGAPHPILGEEVVACLQLETPEDYSEKELRALLHTRLAAYKIPVFFLIYDEFPLRSNGKVDMRALRADMCRKVEQLHQGDSRYNITPQKR